MNENLLKIEKFEGCDKQQAGCLLESFKKYDKFSKNESFELKLSSDELVSCIHNLINLELFCIQINFKSNYSTIYFKLK